MNKFIFDVDGTLTPSRGVIDTRFKEYFNEFCRDNQVFLVTGSDKPKTVEQLGEDTYNLCHTVYNCNGNDVWRSNDHIRTSDWILPVEAKEWLTDHLTNSAFPLRTGLHFEHRPGMCNFSVVGRNADAEQRKKYCKWDLESEERVYIAHNFNLIFPELEAKVGGETGIDISPKGLNKSQVIHDFDLNKDELWFFGDAIYEGGNDEPLAKVVTHFRPVTDWKQTLEYLQIFQEQGIAN